MSSTPAKYALAALVAAAVFLTNLGKPRLWDRDEPRNAGAAREMLERGDWVVPTFNGELRAHKPALLYWCMMSSYSVFGVNEFAARLPSALAAIGTCLLVVDLARRLFSASVGLWAGLILATSLNFGVVARAATPDAVLIFWFTAAIHLFVLAAMRKREGEAIPRLATDPREISTFGWCLVYAAMGVAVLAKGLIGFVLPVGVLGLYFLYAPRAAEAGPEGDWRELIFYYLRPLSPLNIAVTAWRMRPWILVVAVSLIAGPWYAAVGARTSGDFLSGFIGEHHVGRFTGAMEGHGGPPFYYLIAVCIGFFPWSVFLGPLLYDAVRQSSQPRRFAPYLLLGCWTTVVIGFFSVAATKLPSYVLPAYPALAVIAAAFVQRLISGELKLAPFWTRGAFATAIVAGVGVAVGVWIAMDYIEPRARPLAAIGLIMGLGGAAAWLAYERLGRMQGLGAYAGASATFCVLLLAVAPAVVDRWQNSYILVEAAKMQEASEPSLATYGLFEPSWAFYAGRRVEPLQTTDDVVDVLAENAAAVVVTLESLLPRLQENLPPGVDVIDQQRRFLRDQNLVVLGRRTQTAAVESPSRR